MQLLTRMLRRLRREESGAGMVEFSIVAIVLFTLMFAVIDFGRLLFLYNNMKEAARAGARYGSIRFEPGTQGPCSVAAVKQAVEDSTLALVLGFYNTKSNTPTVTMSCTGGGGLAPDKITLKIAGVQFRSITPIPFLKNLTLTDSASVRYEGTDRDF